MKEFLSKNLFVNGRIVAKRCRIEWFEKNNYIRYYNQILQSTSFLPDTCSFSERLHCILNDIDNIVKCKQCNKNEVKYSSGAYREYCSSQCSTNSPDVISKIENTKKLIYGDPYPNRWSSEVNKQTILKKYGVTNISKLPEIQLKKEATCLINFGVKHPQQSRKVREKSINTIQLKYGVDNVAKVSSILRRRIQTQHSKWYSHIKDKFKDKIEFLFDVNEYSSTSEEYKFKCVKCKNIFESHLKNGRLPRCLKCNPLISGYSNAEKEIVDWLRSIGITNIQENTKKVITPLELDIFLPDYNLAIEYNGLYWHSELGGNCDKKYHYNKTKKCSELGIDLIHIFEDDWLDKPGIVKSIISNRLNKNVNKIYARKCITKELQFSEVSDFLEQNHIQGKSNSSINLGLFYNDELVSVMTFGSNRKIYGNSTTNQYELIRYCNKINTSVIGGANKLFKYFITKYNPESILTYSAIDKFGLQYKDNIYSKLGFKFLKETTPGYWYINKGIREHRYNYRKNILSQKLSDFDPSLTEWQNMQLNGYNRIWDCGNLKYEWKV